MLRSGQCPHGTGDTGPQHESKIVAHIDDFTWCKNDFWQFNSLEYIRFLSGPPDIFISHSQRESTSHRCILRGFWETGRPLLYNFGKEGEKKSMN